MFIFQTITYLRYVISAAVTLAGYILLSISLFRLARVLALPRPWLAWIPLANLYVLGQIADIYTDNRLTTDEDRADPFYSPSALRRKLLGYGIGCSVTGNIAAVCFGFCLMTGILSFFLALGRAAGGEAEPLPFSEALFVVAGLTAFVAGVLWIALTILFLLSYCPALCRIFTALGAAAPSMLTFLSVIFPPLCGILLRIVTRKVRDTAERFAPLPHTHTESERTL